MERQTQNATWRGKHGAEACLAVGLYHHPLVAALPDDDNITLLFAEKQEDKSLVSLV